MNTGLAPHFHKRFKFLVIMVGSSIQVFLLENDIFGWACWQATCFLEKWREKPERELKYRIPSGRRY
jgi:hypothetical protein